MPDSYKILHEINDWNCWILTIKAMSPDVWQYIDPSLPAEPALPTFPTKPRMPWNLDPSNHTTERGYPTYDHDLKAYRLQYMLYKDKREKVEKIRKKIAKVHTHIVTHLAPRVFVSDQRSAYQVLKALQTKYDALQAIRAARLAERAY